MRKLLILAVHILVAVADRLGVTMAQARTFFEQCRGQFLLRLGLLLALGIVQSLFTNIAAGHGYMTYPKSRAAEQFKGDQKGWPIAGIKAALRREPCIGLKFNRHFTEVAPGPLRLEFLFPDGANHVGFCYAYLFDPKSPGNKIQIGEMMHCARSVHPGAGKKGENIPGQMTVTVPESLPCDPSHCVLQWVWIATHISETDPQRFEHYDNCADLRIATARTENVKGARLPDAASSATRDPNIALGEDHVKNMISYAKTEGGKGNDEAILRIKRGIEELDLNRSVDSSARRRAIAANKRGIELLRGGRVAEAVQAFEVAYKANSADAEIINNLGYAHLRQNHPLEAEPLLLLALVYEPGRANAWANLGENYAKRGRRSEAVACFALAYRFSGNRHVTRQFLENLAEHDNSEISEAARQALKLSFIRP